MRWLVDEAYPDVPVIRLVLDNLNTHRMASLYETFPAAEARRIAKRLEFHHTPKHGSWLNMAEIEFSVLARACLRGRNGDEDSLERAVSACVSERQLIHRCNTRAGQQSLRTHGYPVIGKDAKDPQDSDGLYARCRRRHSKLAVLGCQRLETY